MARGNYPNMSYCMYNNTVLGIEQCIGDMSDSLDEDITFAEYVDNLNTEEQYKFHSMVESCKRFIRVYEELAERDEPLVYED